MHFSVKWFGESFNVNLAKAEGQEEILSIKGCRLVNGSNGEFVSMPSTKNQNTGKYWNHAWLGEKLASHILKLAQESRPSQEKQGKRVSHGDSLENDIPF